MSQLGQSRHFGRQPTTSGLPLEADIVMTGQPRPVLLVYAAAAFKEAFVTLPLLKATSRHLQTSNCRRVIHRA